MVQAGWTLDSTQGVILELFGSLGFELRISARPVINLYGSIESYSEIVAGVWWAGTPLGGGKVEIDSDRFAVMVESSQIPPIPIPGIPGAGVSPRKLRVSSNSATGFKSFEFGVDFHFLIYFIKGPVTKYINKVGASIDDDLIEWIGDWMGSTDSRVADVTLYIEYLPHSGTYSASFRIRNTNVFRIEGNSSGGTFVLHKLSDQFPLDVERGVRF